LQAPITIPEFETISKFTKSVVREERNVLYQRKRMLEALSVKMNVVFKDTKEGRDKLIYRVAEQRVDLLLLYWKLQNFIIIHLISRS